MSNKVGSPPKFKVESTTMRISRVVPKEQHDTIKQQVNNFINQLQSEALQKCADEILKK